MRRNLIDEATPFRHLGRVPPGRRRLQQIRIDQIEAAFYGEDFIAAVLDQ